MHGKQKLEIRKKIEEAIQTAIHKIDQLKALTAAISPENAIGTVSRMNAINNKSTNDDVYVKRLPNSRV
ncbi:MAG: DnaK suppressor protein [Flavobacteriales bacterium]|jgi:DnaK suppressor protein